jgi:uncharacterized protein (DUF58 family)
MIETDFLHHLRRMNLIITKRITSNYTGQQASTQTGQGTLFKDHGIYAPGEDYKKIDWRVYARTDKLHVKRYESERNLTVHVILDYSGSMLYGNKEIKKYEYASMIGIGFAYMALRNNERFVLSTFADQLERFKPHRGKRQLVAILDYLKTKKPQGVSRFELSLRNYAKTITSRSLIVVISDFLYDPEEIRRSLFGFKNHDVKLIQVLDEVEKNMTLKGEFKLKDMETKGLMKVSLSSFARKQYLSKLADHSKYLKHLATQLGAQFYSVTTEKPIFDTFFEVLQ